MGLFDNLAGMLGGGGQSQGQGGMGMIESLLSQGGGGGPSSNVVGSLLGGGQQSPDGGVQAPASGGMAGMLEQLAANGLGEHVSSWLSSNPNLPISPQQIHDALGSQQVQQLASSSGLPIESFLQQLSQHLPQAAAEQAGTAQG